VIIGGGLFVESGGSLVGAIGVSGAPGGDADEACAKAGIEAIQSKLDFLKSLIAIIRATQERRVSPELTSLRVCYGQ
jgi:hypothetical protein